MNEDTEYVGIVAFFRDDGRDTRWKLVVPKKQWKKSDPVKIDVRDSSLSVAGISDEAVRRRSAPQTLNTPRTSGPGVGQPVRPGAAPAGKPASKGTLAKDDWA
jgi:type VI secretion system protein VasD